MYIEDSLCLHIFFPKHLKVDDGLELKAYYAGHVLGAAMFQVRAGHQSIVYTVCIIQVLSCIMCITYTLV